MGLVVAGNLNGEAEALGIAGLGQQGLGLLRVMGVIVRQGSLKILAEGGVHGRAHPGAVALRRQFHHGLLVHGIAQSLPHQHIVKWLDAVIQIDSLDQIHGAFQHGVAVGEVIHLVHGQMGHQIQGAAVQSIEQSGAVLVDAVGHPVQLGTVTIIGIVSLQDEILLDTPGNKLEGAGADGGGILLSVALGQDEYAGNRA